MTAITKVASVTEADKALEFDSQNIPVIRIGKFWLTYCVHGGLWLARDDGEGMQMQGATLETFEGVIKRFWEENF